MSRYPYVWHWRTCQDPNKPPGVRMPHVYADRVGQRLRVIVRGTSMNSALIEFEDGHRSVVSRNALQRAAPAPLPAQLDLDGRAHDLAPAHDQPRLFEPAPNQLPGQLRLADEDQPSPSTRRREQ